MSGVDITELVTSKKDVPSLPATIKLAKNSNNRRKKKNPSVKLLSRPVVVTKKDEGNSDGDVQLKKKHTKGKDTNKSVVLKKQHNKGGTKDIQRESHDIRRESPDDDVSIAKLKQQLFELNRDLEKERNTREMVERISKNMSNELKLIKEKLGEDKHYCLSTLKEELEFEQKLRISVQTDLDKANNMLSSAVANEHKKIRALEKDIEIQKKVNESIKSELQTARDQLGSVKPIEIELSEEKQKSRDLQKRLQYEAAACIALRMELQSVKSKDNRVNELEEELKRERSTSISDGVSVSEYNAVKIELQATNKKLKHLREAKASTTHPPPEDIEYKDNLIRNLKKELHDVRVILKSERKKSTAHQSTGRKKGDGVGNLSLSDWIDDAIPAGHSTKHNTASMIPSVQSPPTNSQRVMLLTPPRNMSRPAEPNQSSSSLASPSSPPSQPSPSPPSHNSLFHFEEDDVSVSHDKAMEPLHDELTFLKSAYDKDEILIQENNNKVTHFIELGTGMDDDDQVVVIGLTCHIPVGYPSSGVLNVKAAIHSANCSHGVRKCALDALPELEELCMYEAKANEGEESIHQIFSLASGWANTDWYNMLSKQRSESIDETKEFTSGSGGGLSFEICVALIYTHHLVETDRIQHIKKNASKLSLGGYIKVGKPGFILVEGNEEDCINLVEVVSNCKKIHHTSTFKIVKKVTKHVSGIDYDGCLPHKIEELDGKIGMDTLRAHCEELVFVEELDDLCLL